MQERHDWYSAGIFLHRMDCGILERNGRDDPRLRSRKLEPEIIPLWCRSRCERHQTGFEVTTFTPLPGGTSSSSVFLSACAEALEVRPRRAKNLRASSVSVASHAKTVGVIAFTFLVRHTHVKSCPRLDQGGGYSASLVKRGIRFVRARNGRKTSILSNRW